MYYYVFDVKRCRKRTQVDAIKNHLTNLGISGEYSYITPNQSAETLAESGINKGYNTIIAVGSDDLVNAIAKVMVGRKEVLGVLPLEGSEELYHLLGSKDWQEAAEALRYRRIREMHTGKTADGNYFLTSIYLDTTYPIEVTVEYKDYLLQVFAKNLLISNHHPNIEKKLEDHLETVIESSNPKSNGLLSRLGSLFSVQRAEYRNNMTFIRARSLRIFTKKPIPLVCGDKIIAKTPQYIESTDEKLRLIVAKNS